MSSSTLKAAAESLRLGTGNGDANLDAARALATLVIAGARRIGQDGKQIAAMKKRMRQWVSYLETYRADVEAVRSNASYTRAQRLALLESMRDSRDERRESL